MILYENEVVPQELLDFLQVKHFHTANKICGFRYVLHLRHTVLALRVAARQFRTDIRPHHEKRDI